MDLQNTPANAPRANINVKESESMRARSRAPLAVLWSNRRSLVAAVALSILITLWAALNLTGIGLGFALPVSAKLQGMEEAASAIARLFAALVLGLFLAEDAGPRMRWVAGGLVALGLGHLIFGYVEPQIQGDPPDLAEGLYEVFVAQTVACALFAIGLFPGRMPRLLVWGLMTVSGALVAGYIVIFEFLDGERWMPLMVRVDNMQQAMDLATPFDWLTPYHWALSALPLVLSIAAALEAFRLSRRGSLPRWLFFAMVLLAGSLLHEYLWPSTYGGEVLTTADMLSLAFAALVAVGGLLELHRVASERAALLATERELASLRADFGAMVAHELGGPVAAIRRLNEMLGAVGTNGEVLRYATSAIDSEVDALDTLITDARHAAAVEHDEFEVGAHPVALATLLNDAKTYASTLPEEHPVEVTLGEGLATGEQVWADPKRIGQVLRNLLSNAAKYSPEGEPIEVRTLFSEGRIRIEVADHGPGIHPDDLKRIFEKFGRGRDRQGKKVPGVGLGLYLSRRIVQTHGGELDVESKLGEGSVFGFDLKVAR